MLLRQKEQRETQVKPDKEAQFPVTLAAKTPDVMTDIVLLQKSTGEFNISLLKSDATGADSLNLSSVVRV
jgi:hypothetical protein